MTKFGAVRLGSTVRMPFGMYEGKLLHELPADYIAVVLEYELDPWLKEALEAEWKRRAPGQKVWPVCATCGNTTDRLIGERKQCSRCAAKV